MIRTAFSTVACPEWTLQRVARAAAQYGYDGVDLRSWGHSGGPGCAFASDPGLTAPEKVRRIVHDHGINVCALAADVRFDAPVRPPVIGDILARNHASVRAGCHMVELASGIGAELLRIFALNVGRRERRSSALHRICDRLARVCDHARNRDVTILIENEGSFGAAADILEIIDRVDSPLLLASYNLLAAVLCGEDPVQGVALLGRRLAMGRLRDTADRWPVLLGDGELPCEAFVKAINDNAERWSGGGEGGSGKPWVVYNWDRAGVGGLDGPEVALARASGMMLAWSGQGNASGTSAAPTPQSTAPTVVLGS